MGYDLISSFDNSDFPEEHRLIQTMENGTRQNFPEVLNDQQKSLLILPDNVFHYERGRDNVVVHIQMILDKIKSLEQEEERILSMKKFSDVLSTDPDAMIHVQIIREKVIYLKNRLRKMNW